MAAASLPLRECGLKYGGALDLYAALIVTPLAGVWIEICYYNSAKSISKASLPLRECGLKYAAVAKLVPV